MYTSRGQNSTHFHRKRVVSAYFLKNHFRTCDTVWLNQNVSINKHSYIGTAQVNIGEPATYGSENVHVWLSGDTNITLQHRIQRPGRGGPRNMKSMWPPLTAIFFMTCFYRAGGAMAPSAPPWIRYCSHILSLADPRGGARDARPPWGSKFFHFHAVFGKNVKNNSNFGSWRPPLGKILDPPLYYIHKKHRSIKSDVNSDKYRHVVLDDEKSKSSPMRNACMCAYIELCLMINYTAKVLSVWLHA